jgi:hypothetical protein
VANIATPNKPNAAFPQGQAAFPNNPKLRILDELGRPVKRILDELGGSKPAY